MVRLTEEDEEYAKAYHYLVKHLLLSFVFMFSLIYKSPCWRHGGLMVSALNSGASGPGSSPPRDNVLCSWVRQFTLTVPLSTQVYKWVLANLMLGVTLQWTSIPSWGGVEILLVASCYRNQDKLRPGGPQLVRMQTLPYLPTLPITTKSHCLVASLLSEE